MIYTSLLPLLPPKTTFSKQFTFDFIGKISTTFFLLYAQNSYIITVNGFKVFSEHPLIPFLTLALPAVDHDSNVDCKHDSVCVQL